MLYEFVHLHLSIVAPKHMHEILKHFTTDNDGNVLWKNLTFNTSHGVCKAPTIKNGTVA